MNTEMISGLIMIIAAIVLLGVGELLLFIWKRRMKKM